jgi:hypothetical protein
MLDFLLESPTISKEAIEKEVEKSNSETAF